MKTFLFVSALLAVLTLASCRNENQNTRTAISSSSEEVKSLDDDAFIEELSQKIERAGLATNIREVDVPEDYYDFYQSAQQIIEFDIGEETTADEVSGTPPNQMRTGKVITFANEKDKNETIQYFEDYQYFDLMGVDTNYIHPEIISVPDRNIILQLNKNIGDAMIEEYKMAVDSIE